MKTKFFRFTTPVGVSEIVNDNTPTMRAEAEINKFMDQPHIRVMSCELSTLSYAGTGVHMTYAVLYEELKPLNL